MCGAERCRGRTTAREASGGGTPKLQRRQPPRAVVAHRMSVIHRTRRSTSLDRSTACTHPRATRVHAEFAEWWRLGHRHRHGPRSPRRSASGVEIAAPAHRSSPSTAQSTRLLSRHLSRSSRHARTADGRAGRDYEGRGTAFADSERSLMPRRLSVPSHQLLQFLQSVRIGAVGLAQAPSATMARSTEDA